MNEQIARNVVLVRAIEMADQGDRQARPQVQAHRGSRTEDARLQTTQRLEQPFDMLDRLAVGPEDLVIGPALRQSGQGQR